jgi:hypothetical protein
MRVAGLMVGAVGCLLASATPARATVYDFALIADSATSIFTTAMGAPVLNNAGTVGIRAGIDGGGAGVFRVASGGAITMLVRTSNAANPSIFASFSNDGSINSNGAVAFRAGLNAGGGGGNGIFVAAPGGVVTAIAQTSGPVFSALNNFSLNDSGLVAFQATLDAGGTGIFTGFGGSATTLASSTSPQFSAFGNSPSVNDNGVVAFRASLDAGGTGLFAASGGVATTLALSSSPLFSVFDISPVINDSGTVAFIATRDSGGGEGVFSISAGVVTTHALAATSTYSNFETVAINDGGEIVFATTLDGGSNGLFTGADPVEDLLISTGMSLFGSTVTDLGLSTESINDNGAIAFRATLANGPVVLVLATPQVVVDPRPVSAPAGTALLFLSVLMIGRGLKKKNPGLWGIEAGVLANKGRGLRRVGSGC